MNEVERNVVNFLGARSVFLQSAVEADERILGKIRKYLRSHSHILKIYQGFLVKKDARIVRQIKAIQLRIEEIHHAQDKLRVGEKAAALNLLEKMSEEILPIHSEFRFQNSYLDFIQNMERELMEV